MEKELAKKIEAVLFFKNEPMNLKELSKIFDKPTEEIRKGMEELKHMLSDTGLSLIENGEDFSLATSSEFADLIAKLAKDELSKDIGKAGLETLSITLYQGPVSRREIDYIRGVNSNFILRSLMMRGLVERIENKTDARTYLYKPTIELLAKLGLESTAKLPRFEEVQKEIEVIKQSNAENRDTENAPN